MTYEINVNLLTGINGGEGRGGKEGRKEGRKEG